MPRRSKAETELLHGPEGVSVVYLLDAAGGYETKLLRKWLEKSVDSPRSRRVRSSRRRHSPPSEDLSDLTHSDPPTFLIPVRVVWMAPDKDGRRSVGWSDAFKPGDPRDPRGLRAWYIRTFRPGRVKLIAATGATVGDLVDAYEESGEIDGVTAFITRRAWRTLDKVERALRGNRYKIPRFVPEAILSRGEFALAIDEYSMKTGTDPAEARATAAGYLNEIAATHSPYVIDLIANAIHTLYKQGYGAIRYSEDEVSRVAALGSEHPIETSLGLQKLAFEVMYRIGRVTPTTPIAVVSIALLAARGKARTAEELAEDCAHLVDFTRARDLPTTESLELANATTVTGILDWLAEHGNVSSHEAIGRRVFWLDDEQMIRISYYRNVVVHFFVNRAIAEISLTSMIDTGDRSVGSVEDRMLALRDLLKFEFFFPDKDEFLASVSADIEVDVPGWESNIGTVGPLGVLAKMGEPVAYWALLPILDAYQIVGDELENLRGEFNEKAFLTSCLDRARLYRIEERLFSGESASQVLFKSALALARNRDLIEDSPEVGERRAGFAAEVRATRQSAAEGI